MRKILAVAVVALAPPVFALASGQAMSRVVSAKLKRLNEVPVKGDPNGTGFVVVTFNTNKGNGVLEVQGRQEDRSACRRHGGLNGGSLRTGRRGEGPAATGPSPSLGRTGPFQWWRMKDVGHGR